jgi:hypothetical protein
MMKGMGLLSSLMGRKMGKMNGKDNGESSVSITIEKEMEKPDEMMGGGMPKYAKGGRIDGCAIKGKTKGTYR